MLKKSSGTAFRLAHQDSQLCNLKGMNLLAGAIPPPIWIPPLLCLPSEGSSWQRIPVPLSHLGLPREQGCCEPWTEAVQKQLQMSPAWGGRLGSSSFCLPDVLSLAWEGDQSRPRFSTAKGFSLKVEGGERNDGGVSAGGERLGIPDQSRLLAGRGQGEEGAICF